MKTAGKSTGAEDIQEGWPDTGFTEGEIREAIDTVRAYLDKTRECLDQIEEFVDGLQEKEMTAGMKKEADREKRKEEQAQRLKKQEKIVPGL